MTNVAVITGRLARDPETRDTQNGTTVTGITVVTDRPARDKDGKTYKDENGFTAKDSEFHRVTCFNGLGKTVGQYCMKGQLVAVQGRIHYTQWEAAGTRTGRDDDQIRASFRRDRRRRRRARIRVHRAPDRNWPMNALTLRRMVAEELGSLQLPIVGKCDALGELRKTCWTRELPGFGTRHYASGRKVYVVQARMEARSRTVTIGNAKVLSRAQAMDVARRVLLRSQTGENPAEKRKRLRKIPSYRDFLETYWDRVSRQWKASTLHTQRYYKLKYLDRAFEGMFLDEIEERHVQEWFNRITNTGGPGAANRCGEILRAMFNKAEQWGVRPEGSNPYLYIRKNKGRKCERFLSDQEFRRIGEVLDRHRKAFPLHCAAISLLILTGCRKSEITGLQWSEVRGRRLLLSDSKTGPRTVWLAEAAATILQALPRREKQHFVFWNQCTQRPITDVGTLWSKLRDEAGLPGVRIHDLRHSFASHAAAHSETLPMIGKLLGHADVRTTTRYAHLDDSHVIEAAQRIGDLIELSMSDHLVSVIQSNRLRAVE